MKQFVIISGAILLTVNLLLGLILSSFDIFNVCVSSAVIVVTTGLLYLINAMRMKDGYKVSLFLLLSLFGMVEYGLSLFAPSQFTDNWWLIVIILLTAMEAILLFITHKVSVNIH